MSWFRDWSNSSWASSSWDKNGWSGWNNRDWQRGPSNRSGPSPPSQSSVPGGTVSIPSSFTPEWECYDTNSVSNKKFFRNIQSTPWSTKSGLAGKDIADLRVTELTRKGLDDFSLLCLSIVFVKSISEAAVVFQPASSYQAESYRPGCSPSICMAQLLPTNIRSRRGSCNPCWEMLFEQSSPMP